MQVCLIFSLTENVSLKDIILLLGNQRRCVLTPNIIVLRYQKSNFHASNLLHKYTEFESFSLPLKEHHNESAHIFRMYSVLFSHCFNDKLKKKKNENKTVLESDSDDITDSESSSYSPECNKCLGVRPVCLSRCNCLPHYLCIYFEKEFKSF